MKHEDSRLVRHLAFAVVLKLLVLALLWRTFARRDLVSVDAGATAQRIGTATSPGGAKPWSRSNSSTCCACSSQQRGFAWCHLRQTH